MRGLFLLSLLWLSPLAGSAQQVVETPLLYGIGSLTVGDEGIEVTRDEAVPPGLELRKRGERLEKATLAVGESFELSDGHHFGFGYKLLAVEDGSATVETSHWTALLGREPTESKSTDTVRSYVTRRTKPADAPGFVAPTRGLALPAPLARVLTDYERAWQARDPRALAALFAEEGFVLPNGAPAVRGRAAIEGYYAGHGGPLSLRAFAFATEGSTGYILGGYARQPGQPDVGKFTLTLRRDVSGRWLIVSDMDNGNARP